MVKEGYGTGGTLREEGGDVSRGFEGSLDERRYRAACSIGL